MEIFTVVIIDQWLEPRIGSNILAFLQWNQTVENGNLAKLATIPGFDIMVVYHELVVEVETNQTPYRTTWNFTFVILNAKKTPSQDTPAMACQKKLYKDS